MRACDRTDSKNCGPIVHVLNGFYPEADVGRMSLDGLERLVTALVKRTTDRTDRPKWWPPTIAYNSKINLGLADEREIKLALKQLIVNCSQFFNKERDGNRNKWSLGWKDENQRKKRSRRRPRPLLSLLPIPFVYLERTPTPDSPSKHQFLQYFYLSPKQCKLDLAKTPPQPLGGALKLTHCNNVPFSSDVGRLMAIREQHHMPESLKLKRLERSEWYTNKETAKTTEVEFEVAPATKEIHHFHHYKMPKRQFHQRRPGLHDAEFLAKFCTPVYVHLDRFDLEKVRCVERQLVVVIDKKMYCDVKTTKTLRSSLRLRNV